MAGTDPASDDVEDGFVVVRNDDGEYSVWWRDREVPAGWAVVGVPEPRSACLGRIGRLWTQPRPAPVRVRVTDALTVVAAPASGGPEAGGPEARR